LITSIVLGGCSLNVPTLGAFEAQAPATTGSIGGRLDVAEPLPNTLAYSDARTIGEAAAAALWQAGDVEDWVNRATGSSGTLQPHLTVTDADAGGCRSFDTIVTSIGGVHHYSGRVCRGDEGRSVLRIDPSQGESPS
jgi:hypothetical protein